MAGRSTHADISVHGFCLCHLLALWRLTGRLGHYLGYYNVNYSETQQRFVCEAQLYVHFMGLFHLVCSLAYLLLSQHWIYDRLIFLIYVPLFVYSLLLRPQLTRLLNECAALHDALQQALGELLCVRIVAQCALTFMVPAQLLLLLAWQTQMYYGYQVCFIAGVAIIYHLQLMFQANYLIWLTCIYRALNVFLTLHMNGARLIMLKQLLSQQQRIEILHLRICRYFSLHLLSFLALTGFRIWQLLQPQHSILRLRADRLILGHLALLAALLATLLVIAYALQRQRGLFGRHLLRLADRAKYFKLKTWHLLKHQLMPMPFGLPVVRLRVPTPQQRQQRKRDVIDMLFCSNLCVAQLPTRQTPLLLTALPGCKLYLNLRDLPRRFCKMALLLLMALGLRLVHRDLIAMEFYTAYPRNNFDVNVTKTISKIYRFYAYDELE